MKKLFGILMSSVLSMVVVAASAQTIDDARAKYYESMKGKKVIFIALTAANELAQVWLKGMKPELEPLGITIETRDANASASTGAQAFTQAIAQNPAVILSWNPDLTAYARLIQQAQAKGIHVISMNMISNAPASAYIGPDWVRMGEAQAEAVAKACDGKSGKIAVIQGQVTSAANQFTMQGINEYIAAHPGLEIVANQSADWNAEKAKGITSAILKQHPDLCAVIGSYEGMDLGIAAAIKEAGLTGKVHLSSNGIGSQRNGCDMVKSGAWDSYVMYDIRKQNTVLNALIPALIDSGVKPDQMKALIYTPLTVITKENADQPNLCWQSDI